MDRLAPGIGEQLGARLPETRRQAIELGVFGDRQEIQRTNQLHRLPGVGGDLLAPRETECIVDVESRADQARIERHLGVKMGIAKEHLIRVGAAYVG